LKRKDRSGREIHNEPIGAYEGDFSLLTAAKDWIKQFKEGRIGIEDQTRHRDHALTRIGDKDSRGGHEIPCFILTTTEKSDLTEIETNLETNFIDVLIDDESWLFGPTSTRISR